MKTLSVSFVLNGEPLTVDVQPEERLLDVLRNTLGMTGTKEGCSSGECGACTVIINGNAVASCMLLAPMVEGKTVETIEGVAKNGVLHPVQKAMLQHHAVQCGFCSPGFVMTGKALLEKNPDASREEIMQGISGNLCRCTGYTQIADALVEAGQEMKYEK